MLKFFDSLLEKLGAGLAEIATYFNTVKHISLLEGILWLFAFVMTLDLLIFDVTEQAVTYQFINERFWEVGFSLLTITHFCAMFFKKIYLRIFIAYCYILTWFSWTITIGYSRIGAPLTPILGVICLMSVFLALRLSRKKNPIFPND